MAMPGGGRSGGSSALRVSSNLTMLQNTTSAAAASATFSSASSRFGSHRSSSSRNAIHSPRAAAIPALSATAIPARSTRMIRQPVARGDYDGNQHSPSKNRDAEAATAGRYPTRLSPLAYWFQRFTYHAAANDTDCAALPSSVLI